MYRVYGDIRSGNCYKIKLLMQHLQLEHEWVAMNILKGETQTSAYLAMNPNGKIPLLELSPGEYLTESNAILNFLAQGSAYLPEDALARARVLEWQFFEQYSHEPYIAVARFIQLFLGLPAERREEYQAKQQGGHKALGVMEQRLTSAPWLANGALSIADISLYAYTHVAHEGGFDLAAYPAIQGWLARVADHPRHISMAEA
jgi:glutathione S-transferase